MQNNKAVHAQAKQDRKSLLVPLGDKQSNNASSVYLVPGVGGHVFSFKQLGRSFSKEWNLFGLLHPIIRKEFHETIEEVAERLVSDIVEHQPAGPYYILGHSMGALIALEVARILRQRQEKVILVFLDSRAIRKAPKRVFFVRIPMLLYCKLRLHMENLSKGRTRRQNKLAALTRGEVQDVQLPKALQTAFDVGWQQLNVYHVHRCDVPAILIKSGEVRYWDMLDNWPEDYGWSKYVDLMTVTHSPGDHLTMVKLEDNVIALAKKIEIVLAEAKTRLGLAH